MINPNWQKLIDNKEWDKLSKTDFLTHWNFQAKDWKSYNTNNELFTEFFFNPVRMAEAYSHGSPRYYFEDVAQHISMRMMSHTFTKDEYVKMFSQLDKLAAISPFVNSLGMKELLNFHVRSSEDAFPFIEALAEQSVIDSMKFLRSYRTTFELQDWMFKYDNDIMGVVFEEYKHLFFFVDSRVSDRSKISECFDTISGLIDVIKLSVHSFEIGDILRPYKQDEFEQAIKPTISSFQLKEFMGILEYYESNPDYVLPSFIIDEMEKYPNKNVISFSRIISENLTRDQIDRFRKSGLIDNIGIAKRKDGLKILKEIGVASANVSTARFFREDEIIKYPEYFWARQLAYSGDHYVSRDTFKLLNKVRGERRKYSNKLQSFGDILSGLGIRRIKTLTIDDVKYLKEKTKASNEEVARVFEILGRYKLVGDVGAKIKIISDLLNHK